MAPKSKIRTDNEQVKVSVPCCTDTGGRLMRSGGSAMVMDAGRTLTKLARAITMLRARAFSREVRSISSPIS